MVHKRDKFSYYLLLLCVIDLFIMEIIQNYYEIFKCD